MTVLRERVVVGEHTRGEPLRAPGSKILYRFDPEASEQQLASTQDRRHLGDRAAHRVEVTARGDRADVRETGESGETAPAEVETVELHLLGCVSRRHRHDERAQRRRLARLRAAHDGDIACAAGDVEEMKIAALIEGAVDDADGDDEISVRRGFATVTPDQRVDCRRLVERRQPHTVRGRTVSGDTTDERLQQRRDAHGCDSAHSGTSIARRWFFVEQRQGGIEHRTARA